MNEKTGNDRIFASLLGSLDIKIPDSNYIFSCITIVQQGFELVYKIIKTGIRRTVYGKQTNFFMPGGSAFVFILIFYKTSPPFCLNLNSRYFKVEIACKRLYFSNILKSKTLFNVNGDPSGPLCLLRTKLSACA